MVKIYVERNEAGINVKGEIDGKPEEILTELTMGVKDVLEQLSNPDFAKRAFKIVATLVLR